MERAVRRGDALAKEDAPGPFERALDYYRFADDATKIQALRDRAARLGDMHAAKGETQSAIRFYQIAELDDKAKALRKSSEAKREQTEAQRKKKFDREQEALEKDLGL